MPQYMKINNKTNQVFITYIIYNLVI